MSEADINIEVELEVRQNAEMEIAEPIGDYAAEQARVYKEEAEAAAAAARQAQNMAEAWAESSAPPAGENTRSAKTWSDVARQWAESDTEPDNVTGAKSSKTWAEESADSADASETSANESANSAAASTGSAKAAAKSEENAADSEAAAKTSADAAANSAASAEESASAANTSKIAAAASEANAANSAASAVQSAADAEYVSKHVNVFIPSVSSAGDLSWLNKAGLENPSPVNIKGPTGPQGPMGPSGSKGTRGSLWYRGTAITGTSTTATVFSNSGITSALVNDMYLNTSTGYVYTCTVAGAASVAKWAYSGSIKGATGATGPRGPAVTASSITVTKSTQAAISPSSPTWNSGSKVTRSYFDVVTGIAAGSYTVAALLQQLVDKSHTHRSLTVAADCNCDCGDDS